MKTLAEAFDEAVNTPLEKQDNPALYQKIHYYKHVLNNKTKNISDEKKRELLEKLGYTCVRKEMWKKSNK